MNTPDEFSLYHDDLLEGNGVRNNLQGSKSYRNRTCKGARAKYKHPNLMAGNTGKIGRSGMSREGVRA